MQRNPSSLAETGLIVPQLPASILFDGNDQLAEPAEDVVEVASLLLDMESLDPGGKGKKDGVHFELRQMLPNAHVRSPTKRNVLCRTARHIKPVRIWRG